MEFNDIKQLAALMKDMGLTTLEYSEGDKSVRMERGAAVNAVAIQPQAQIDVKADVAAPTGEPTDGLYTLKSPMVGMFYAAPSADKKPYVAVGDRVEAGDVLCIIEAMKMMNEITADKSGVISEICATNKQVVDYGHPLFRMTLA